MFCFCFQSPSLKLQALEADASPPDPNGEEPKDPRELYLSLRSDHKALLHSPPPTMDDSPQRAPSPSLPSFGAPAPPTVSPGDDSVSPRSPSSPGGPPLLSVFAVSECPVPSPRCPNLSGSLRYNQDPDAAPSPPCSQHIRMARCSHRAEPDDCSSSVTVLRRHVQTLRKRIRQLEEHFEQERLKPSYYDKSAHPEVARLIKELLKSRKQLKELKLCHAEQGIPKASSHPPSERTTELQQSNNGGKTEPSVQETLQVVATRLSDKRRELNMPDKIKEMTPSQMRMEKSSLQKSLLYFESLHGRPNNTNEWSLVQPLYERYRILKQLLLSSNASALITTIEEEEGSDDDGPKEECLPTGGTPLPQPTSEMSDTPPVSPLEEVKCLQPPVFTMATLHEASRSELLDHLRITRLEKRRLHRALHEFEDLFYTLSGRVCQKEDRGPMAEEYCQYKNLKAKLRLLEALLSKKQDAAKCPKPPQEI
ncbi:protein FAM13C [Stigmatopora nigra]